MGSKNLSMAPQSKVHCSNAMNPWESFDQILTQMVQGKQTELIAQVHDDDLIFDDDNNVNLIIIWSALIFLVKSLTCSS